MSVSKFFGSLEYSKKNLNYTEKVQSVYEVSNNMCAYEILKRKI